MNTDIKTDIKKQENEEIEDIDTVQYLTFKLDDEAFATEIDNVREVLEYSRITRVPRTPEYMLGVINLRGSIVPVVDLRLQFSMPVVERTVDTCIIIIEIEMNDNLTVVGALVDSVQEVINLAPGQLSPPPTMGAIVSNDYISAMGKADDRFVIILDLDTLFTIEAEMFSRLADANHRNRKDKINNFAEEALSNDVVTVENVPVKEQIDSPEVIHTQK